MSTKEELAAAVAAAKAALATAESALKAFDTSPENNVFATLEEAEGVLEDRMRDWAFRDCEGAHNCGADEYTQESSSWTASTTWQPPSLNTTATTRRTTTSTAAISASRQSKPRRKPSNPTPPLHQGPGHEIAPLPLWG